MTSKHIQDGGRRWFAAEGEGVPVKCIAHNGAIFAGTLYSEATGEELGLFMMGSVVDTRRDAAGADAVVTYPVCVDCATDLKAKQTSEDSVLKAKVGEASRSLAMAFLSAGAAALDQCPAAPLNFINSFMEENVTYRTIFFTHFEPEALHVVNDSFAALEGAAARYSQEGEYLEAANIMRDAAASASRLMEAYRAANDDTSRLEIDYECAWPEGTRGIVGIKLKLLDRLEFALIRLEIRALASAAAYFARAADATGESSRGPFWHAAIAACMMARMEFDEQVLRSAWLPGRDGPLTVTHLSGSYTDWDAELVEPFCSAGRTARAVGEEKLAAAIFKSAERSVLNSIARDLQVRPPAPRPDRYLRLAKVREDDLVDVGRAAHTYMEAAQCYANEGEDMWMGAFRFLRHPTADGNSRIRHLATLYAARRDYERAIACNARAALLARSASSEAEGGRQRYALGALLAESDRILEKCSRMISECEKAVKRVGLNGSLRVLE